MMYYIYIYILIVHDHNYTDLCRGQDNVVGSNIGLGILSQLVEFAKLPCPGLVQLHQITHYEIM